MPSNVRWHPEAFENRMDRGLARNVEKAAIMYENAVKQSFGHSGVLKKRAGASAREREVNRSKAGETPHVQTGTLKRSITHQKVGDFMQRVGSLLKPEGGQRHSYALYLEYGTDSMAARPYFRPMFRSMRGRLRRIIAGKI